MLRGWINFQQLAQSQETIAPARKAASGLMNKDFQIIRVASVAMA